MDRRSRRQFLQRSLPLAGLGLLAGCGILPRAAQPTAPNTEDARRTGGAHVFRIGWLSGSSREDAAQKANLEALRQGLREHGYIEGQNIVIEWRHADGELDRLPDLAAELVGLKVDLICAQGAPAVVAAKQATGTIPIVFGAIADPVGTGLVSSLARPGGNATGTTTVNVEVTPKRLELLKEAFPQISRVGYLFNPAGPASARGWQVAQGAAQALELTFLPLEVRGPDEFDGALEAATREGLDGLYIAGGAVNAAQQPRIVAFAARRRLPATSTARNFVDAGGLMSYGPDRRDGWRRAATYVDRILKGAKPADLPVQQSTKLDFVINLKTAQALGLTIPESVLEQATEVIR